jgi:hypothetical protein
MIATGSNAPRCWLARLGWLAFTAVALWSIWGWQADAVRTVDEVPVVRKAAEFAALEPGQQFLLEGELTSLDESPAHWRGRLTWVRTERRWLGDNQWAHPVVEEHRPPIAITSEEFSWLLPAGSYDLGLAPKIPDDPWYRWNQVNRGFKGGDRVLARGGVEADGNVVIHQLAAGPLAHHARSMRPNEAAGAVLINFVRILVTGLVIVIVWSALMRTRSSRLLLRLMTENQEQRFGRGH